MLPAGSGSSSDFDARQFLQSLPSIGNTPGGNQIITDTFQAVSQNKLDAAEIAQRAQSGDIRWQDAERQIRALPNPYQRYREFRKNGGGGSPASAPVGGTQAAFGQQFAPNGVPVGDSGGQAARPTSDAEFDALPSAALYIDPDDGKPYRKP